MGTASFGNPHVDYACFSQLVVLGYHDLTSSNSLVAAVQVVLVDSHYHGLRVFSAPCHEVQPVSVDHEKIDMAEFGHIQPNRLVQTVDDWRQIYASAGFGEMQHVLLVGRRDVKHQPFNGTGVGVQHYLYRFDSLQ